MESLRIPLFPLDVVLLPKKSLPLHIFEPRYKLMIRNAVEQDAPFGVVRVDLWRGLPVEPPRVSSTRLSQGHSIARVGCTARVVRIIKTYGDGRMDIATVGETVFRIREVHDEKPYLEATVDIEPDDMQPGPPEVTAELRTLFENCQQLLHGAGQAEASWWPADNAESSLAYELAEELPLDANTQQELLEMRNEVARRSRLAEELRQLVAQLVRIAHVREVSTGNGHGAGNGQKLH
jgi:Lon protease-like protein